MREFDFADGSPDGSSRWDTRGATPPGWDKTDFAYALNAYVRRFGVPRTESMVRQVTGCNGLVPVYMYGTVIAHIAKTLHEDAKAKDRAGVWKKPHPLGVKGGEGWIGTPRRKGPEHA